jgi:o-succinylbenzoate synthase
MKIISVKIARLQIPLKQPFITAIRQTTHVDDVVVVLSTKDGKRAYGSAAATPAITGDSHDSIVDTLQNVLAPQLIGKDIREFSNLLQLNDRIIPNNSSAKAAIDMALHDLFAQFCGLPLYQLFGSQTNAIRTCVTISAKSEDEMVQDALSLVSDGFTTLKIKLGKTPNEDVQTVTSIRQTVGDGITLLTDANQGWQLQEALTIIRQFEQLGLKIMLIEQPVIADDLVSLKQISDTVSTWVVADESCFSPRDALNLTQMRACKAVNIKLMKSGGLENAKAIYAITKSGSIASMVGCMLESPIGVAAMASFALSKPDILCADLDPLCLIRENYVLGGAQLIGNKIYLPEKPGLGIEGIEKGLTLIGEVS